MSSGARRVAVHEVDAGGHASAGAVEWTADPCKSNLGDSPEAQSAAVCLDHEYMASALLTAVFPFGAPRRRNTPQGK